MRTWVIALWMAGCAGHSLHLTHSGDRSLPREDPRATSETITQRFDAPILSVAVGSAVTCVLLDAISGREVECWGSLGGRGRAPRRARWSTSFIEIWGERGICGRDDGGVACLRAGHWERVPVAHSTDDSEVIATARLVGDALTQRCEVDGRTIECVFDLPADGTCFDGHLGQPCTEVSAHAASTLIASTEAVSAEIVEGVLCAERLDGRFECWFVPGSLFRLGAIGEPDDAPTRLGVFEATLRPIFGAGRACAVDAADPQRLTCMGFSAVGAESFAGAVGVPRDSRPRAFLAERRAATARDEHVGPLCTGGAFDASDFYACRVEDAWVSFDGANRCELGEDHVLRCVDREGAQSALSNVREHVAGPGTLYWVELDGTAWCMGNNRDVQCQDDGPRTVDAPHRLALPAVLHISAGVAHACAVSADGAVWCWGANADLQVTGALFRGELEAPREVLDPSESPAYLSPTQVLPPGSAVDVACGAYTTCAALSDGSTRCW